MNEWMLALNEWMRQMHELSHEWMNTCIEWMNECIKYIKRIACKHQMYELMYEWMHEWCPVGQSVMAHRLQNFPKLWPVSWKVQDKAKLNCWPYNVTTTSQIYGHCL